MTTMTDREHLMMLEADLANARGRIAELEAALGGEAPGSSAAVISEMQSRDFVAARAALTALRTPSPEMVEAGAAGMYGKNWDSDDPLKRPGEKMKDVWRRYAHDAFRAAIDAALKEKGNDHD